MSFREEALEFIHQLQTNYFERRDMDAVLASMETRTSWIGTGPQEFCEDIEDARSALAEDMNEHAGVFVVTNAHYDVLELSPTSCVIYGSVCAEPCDEELADIDYRISAACIKTEQGLRLLHLHVSTPNPDQEGGHHYVRRSALSERNALKARAAKMSSELQIRNNELAAISENIPGGVCQCRDDGSFGLLSMSSGFLSLFDYTREEISTLFEDKLLALVHPSDRAAVLKIASPQCSEEESIEFECKALHRDNTLLWVLAKGKRVSAPDGTQTFYFLIVDITARKKEQEQLRLSLERHQIITDQATDILFEWDIQNDTLTFSPNWRKKFGYEAINTRISSRIPKSHNIHPEDMSAFVKLMRDTAGGVPYSETKFRILSSEGIFTWCRIRATTQYDENKRPIAAVGVIIDIDEDKKQKDALLEQAQKDALTGLYNKNTVTELTKQQITCCSPLQNYALLIIDVDNFKSINDTYGHLCGDRLLADIAGILKMSFRTTDIIGRIGGDEFMVLMSGIRDGEIVEIKARALIAALGRIRPAEKALPVSCSIGIATLVNESGDYYDLYRLADRALYYVKNNGRGSFAFYDPALCADIFPTGEVCSAISAKIDSESEPIR